MWRPVQMSYQQDSSVESINTLRFGLAESTLANLTTNPENKCYFQERTGFFNLSSALYAPLLVTKAYYLDANTDGLLNFTINGNKTWAADRGRDDSFIDIEPITGAPMRVSVKVQTNFQVGPQPTYCPPTTAICPPPDYVCGPIPSIYNNTQNLTSTMIPFFVAEDYFELGSKLASQYKSTVLVFINFAYFGGIAFTAFGALVFLCLGFVVFRKKDDDEEERYLNLNRAPSDSGLRPRTGV